MRVLGLIVALLFASIVYAQMPLLRVGNVSQQFEHPIVRSCIVRENQLFTVTRKLLQSFIDSGYLSARVDSIRLLDTAPPRQYRVHFCLAARNYLYAEADSVVWTERAMEQLARKYARQHLNAASLETQLKVQIHNQGQRPVLGFTTVQAVPYPLVSIENHGDLQIPTRLWYSLFGLKKESRFASNELLYVDRVLASIPYLRLESASRLELLDTGAVRLHLFVTRRDTHFIEGILGFAPSQKGGELAFWGNAHAHFENLLNRGLLLDFRWMGKGRERQRGAFLFQYPYIFESSWGAEMKLDAELQDSTHYKWGGSLGATYRVNGFQQLLLSVERTQVNFSGVESAKQSATLFWSLGHRYRLARWHGAWREGGETEAIFAIGRRDYSHTTARVEGRYSFEGQYVQTLWRDLYVGGALAFVGNLWGGANRLLLEGYSFGGAAHFRGLPESSFFTRQYFYTTLSSGVYLGNSLRLGGVVQWGELEYLRAVRFALSYGGEVELRTQVGQLLIGMSRFEALGDWHSGSNAVLHLQLRLNF